MFYLWQLLQRQGDQYRHHPEKRIISNWSQPRSSTSFLVVGRKSVSWNLDGFNTFSSFWTTRSLFCCWVGVVFLCCFSRSCYFLFVNSNDVFFNWFTFRGDKLSPTHRGLLLYWTQIDRHHRLLFSVLMRRTPFFVESNKILQSDTLHVLIIDDIKT